jgi:hypothetical protein
MEQEGIVDGDFDVWRELRVVVCWRALLLWLLCLLGLEVRGWPGRRRRGRRRSLWGIGRTRRWRIGRRRSLGVVRSRRTLWNILGRRIAGRWICGGLASVLGWGWVVGDRIPPV